MTTNPYESPRGVEDAIRPEPLSPPRKGLGSLLFFIFASLGGGLTGIVIGNLLAIALGLLTLSTNPYGTRGNDSIIGINHFLSLVLLVVGSFVGGYVAIRITDRIAAPGTLDKEPVSKSAGPG